MSDVLQFPKRPPPASPDGQCQATNRRGTRCANRVVSAPRRFCADHDPDAPRCSGTTYYGEPCRKRPVKGGRCEFHQFEESEMSDRADDDGPDTGGANLKVPEPVDEFPDTPFEITVDLPNGRVVRVRASVDERGRVDRLWLVETSPDLRTMIGPIPAARARVLAAMVAGMVHDASGVVDACAGEEEEEEDPGPAPGYLGEL